MTDENRPDEALPNQPHPPTGPQPSGDSGVVGPSIEQFQHRPIGARLPERLSVAVLATGAVVLEGPGEFVVDFVQAVTRPPRVVARVVLNPQVMGQFVEAFKENLSRYEQQFGPPKLPPKPPTDRRPSIQELYDELKLPDEQLSGAYANTVMISHTPAEFLLDFITRFFPRAAVSARLCVAASNVARMIETMSASFQHYLNRVNPPRPQPSGDANPPSAGGANPPSGDATPPSA